MIGNNDDRPRVTNPALLPPKRQQQPQEPQRPEQSKRRRSGRAAPVARINLPPELAELHGHMADLSQRLERAQRALRWGLLPLPVALMAGLAATFADAGWPAAAAAATVTAAAAAPVFIGATRIGNPAARHNDKDGNPAARNSEGK